MATFKSYLRAAMNQQRTQLIEKLLVLGHTKMPDGRKLYELTITELTEEYQDAIRKRKISS
ncbi:Fur-regulated basic protein FbpA [Mesobacillus stamsii]|uniref:Fur-regulated basic protein FbpA n=1 Tax=Mesobacillus stamsii TaxID=225347 RepID=A0ABU0FSK5_9BACI|nr:Fur-regulated basic protein FbpA [Mesobacillus stamsii]MDQ0412904.1 hypothetical protein [Mesobacillus stamsii]